MLFNTAIKSSPVTVQDDGWVAPDGQWFPCKSCEHDYLAYQLCGYNGDKLEQLGWVHISFANICNEYGLDLSQKQRDTLFDLQQLDPRSYYGKGLGEWLNPEEDQW